MSVHLQIRVADVFNLLYLAFVTAADVAVAIAIATAAAVGVIKI